MNVAQLVQGDLPFGRFGTAIASLGDLDGDGRSDVAISAPYGEKESGRVFIYTTLPDGKTLVSTQEIIGSELNLQNGLNANLMSFGASLQGSVDVDGNYYNGE